jgi:hypothetical protein
MPLPTPPIDSRTYQQLVDETLARVPAHTPEWTNFSPSDPGVTLVQMFAFLADAMIYRANQIPARNRAKFLQLLGVPLRTATAAKGIAIIANERGTAETVTLPGDTELLAGPIAFRTGSGLDVLPVEGRLMVKRAIDNPAPEVLDYYRLLYASYGATLPTSVALYESVQADPARGMIDLSATTDHSLWIALLAREDSSPAAAREALAGRMLSLGMAPEGAATERTLLPGGASPPPADMLSFKLPKVAGGSAIGIDANGEPIADYSRLEARLDFDPLTEAGIAQITLPLADGLQLWDGLDPLETGVGDLPPALEDPKLAGRLVTWIRVQASGGAAVRLRWAGINAAAIRQVVRVAAESLTEGDGTPDQARQLDRAPILANSIEVAGILPDGTERLWREIDDLLAAGPELPVPGSGRLELPSDVFLVDAEAGTLRFGDGLAGRRPAAGERLYASYLYSEGAEGNVGAGSIKGGPLLPAGFTATNPIATWGGADAEDVAAGERQVARYVQHRDRLVTAADFETIAWRTPGVAVGRIEVLPAWHPNLAPAAPGAAPGVVTLMAIPRHDLKAPEAPRPDRSFLDALCAHLDPRRLVTTELVLRGPLYKGIWISVGIETGARESIAAVAEAVRKRLRAVISPLPPPGYYGPRTPLYGEPAPADERGWPLATPVQAKVLEAEVARVPGVRSVVGLLLAEGAGPSTQRIEIGGIELPELLGISVVAGDPVDLASLRGDAGGTGTSGSPGGPRRLPVPITSETC